MQTPWAGGGTGKPLEASDNGTYGEKGLEFAWQACRILEVERKVSDPALCDEGNLSNESGCSSAVEHNVANVVVVGSIPITRSIFI